MKAPQEVETEFVAATSRLFEAFAPYPFVAHVEGCPCCVGNQDMRDLSSAPLRELSSGALSRFAFKALTTWGTSEDLKHYLPRILELVLSPGGFGCEVEVVFGKLGLAEWKSWPEEECSAVKRYFHTGWRLILTGADLPVEPDSWLCGLGRAGELMIPYLEDWAECRSSPAYDHLLRFLDKNLPSYLKRHTLSNSFWSDSPERAAEVCNWLTDPRTCYHLEAIYFDSDRRRYAPTLAEIVDRLELFGRTRS